MEQNIEGKVENPDIQHFVLFIQCFQKLAMLEPQKTLSVGKWLQR